MIIPATGFPPSAGSTPTLPTYTFDTSEASPGVPNNFGITTGVVSVTSGTNAMGGTASFGTTTSALNGFLLSVYNQNRPFALNVYFNGVLAIEAVPGLANTPCQIALPIDVATSTTITVAMSSNANAAFNVSLVPYKTSIPAGVTSLKALGPYTTVATQGASIPALSPTVWTQIGSTTATCKGIASIYIGNGNDQSRTAAPLITNIGMGASTVETVLIPDLVMNSTGNGLGMGNNFGPFYMDIPNSTRLVARARNSDGTLPDAVNVQLLMMY